MRVSMGNARGPGGSTCSPSVVPNSRVGRDPMHDDFRLPGFNVGRERGEAMPITVQTNPDPSRGYQAGKRPSAVDSLTRGWHDHELPGLQFGVAVHSGPPQFTRVRAWGLSCGTNACEPR